MPAAGPGTFLSENSKPLSGKAFLHFKAIVSVKHHDRLTAYTVKGKVYVIYIDITLTERTKQFMQVSNFIRNFNADHICQSADKTFLRKGLWISSSAAVA